MKKENKTVKERMADVEHKISSLTEGCALLTQSIKQLREEIVEMKYVVKNEK